MKPIVTTFIFAVTVLGGLSVSLAAEEGVPETTAANEPDFGDFSSSTLTTKAWNALNAKDSKNARLFAEKCIETYKSQAIEMQKGLTEPTTTKEETEKLWALNDVGTCYFILGQSYEADGKTKEALAAYKFLTENLAFAQCWDEKGWFWKPADAARDKVKSLEFDALE